MQAGCRQDHLVVHLVQMIAKSGGQNGPVFDAGQDMLNDNAGVRNGPVRRLLGVGQSGCWVGFGRSGFLMGDMEFKRCVVGRKAEIPQIDPNFKLGKPVEFARKLRFEEAIIMLTAPNGLAEEKNLATQTGDDGIFH